MRRFIRQVSQNLSIQQGSWTPVLWDDSLSDGESQTYTTQEGSFQKIGNYYFIHGFLEVNSLGTLSSLNAARIGGLPSPAGSDISQSAIYCGHGASLAFTDDTTSPSGIIAAGTAYITLQGWDQTTGTSVLTIGAYSAGGILSFGGHYAT